MFLLVPAYPGCPGSKAVKKGRCCCCSSSSVGVLSLLFFRWCVLLQCVSQRNTMSSADQLHVESANLSTTPSTCRWTSSGHFTVSKLRPDLSLSLSSEFSDQFSILCVPFLCKYAIAAYFAYCCIFRIFQQRVHITYFFCINRHFQRQF